jgi:hypothetical protein
MAYAIPSSCGSAPPNTVSEGWKRARNYSQRVAGLTGKKLVFNAVATKIILEK